MYNGGTLKYRSIIDWLFLYLSLKFEHSFFFQILLYSELILVYMYIIIHIKCMMYMYMYILHFTIVNCVVYISITDCFVFF